MYVFGSLKHPPETEPNLTCSHNGGLGIERFCRCGTWREDTPTVTCDGLVYHFFVLGLGHALMLRYAAETALSPLHPS